MFSIVDCAHRAGLDTFIYNLSNSFIREKQEASLLKIRVQLIGIAIVYGCIASIAKYLKKK